MQNWRKSLASSDCGGLDGRELVLVTTPHRPREAARNLGSSSFNRQERGTLGRECSERGHLPPAKSVVTGGHFREEGS